MFGAYLRFWWEKSLKDTLHVSQVDIQAHIAVTYFLAVDWIVIWTDVTFTRERRDSDGVLQTGIRSAVTQSAIYIALKRDHMYQCPDGISWSGV